MRRVEPRDGLVQGHPASSLVAQLSTYLLTLPAPHVGPSHYALRKHLLKEIRKKIEGEGGASHSETNIVEYLWLCWEKLQKLYTA